MEKVVAIVAAHNEEGTIRKTLHILKGLKKKGIIHNILVVNDGSTDGTYEDARLADVKIISHQKQSGKRKVFATGVRHAHEMGATTVLMLDADIINFPEKSAKEMIAAVRNPKKCLMATAQQHEPDVKNYHASDGVVLDPHSNAQRALNIQAVQPLLRGNKKWVDILEKSTKQKWGLEYALDKLIPKNKKVFLGSSSIYTRPSFRDAHKYKIEREGLRDLFFQQRKDREYVDKVLNARRKLARKKKSQRNSRIRKLFRRKG
jgi:glycosyltransferase involved in cell wall biosynthesis